MHKLFLSISTLAFLTACSAPVSEEKAPADAIEKTSGYDIQAQFDKFAEIPMEVDTSFLSESEKAVVNKLIEASDYLSKIYML